MGEGPVGPAVEGSIGAAMLGAAGCAGAAGLRPRIRLIHPSCASAVTGVTVRSKSAIAPLANSCNIARSVLVTLPPPVLGVRQTL